MKHVRLMFAAICLFCVSYAFAVPYALPAAVSKLGQGISQNAIINLSSGGSVQQGLGIGLSTIAISVHGTWTGTAPTLSVSLDGVYFVASGFPLVNHNTGDVNGITSGAQGIWTTIASGTIAKLTFASGGTGSVFVVVMCGPGASATVAGSGAATAAAQTTTNGYLNSMYSYQKTVINNNYQNAALSNTPVVINSSTSLLYLVIIYNPGGSAVCLELFDNASPTVGTTTPLMHITVGAGLTQTVALPWPKSFATALTVAAESGYKSGSPPGTAIDVNIGWN